MKRFLLIALIGCCFATGSAQTAFELWTDISETALIPGQKRIHAKNYRSLSLNENLLLGLLETAPMENTQDAKNNTLVLELPLPNGKMEQFAVVESPVMAPGLATRYPAIRTYAGRSLENGRSYLRFDITPKGFHAMILAGENTWFIDPFYHTNTGQYIAYYKKDFQTDQSFECLLASVDNIVDTEEKNSNPNPVGEELRTYRLAVAATGEYTQFHGGTVEGALAAIATTMNRVNGIYERDVSVRMILVDSNHLVIFTNGNSDPYSGGNTQRRNQNQEVIDSRIGPANYDIGHVFDTGGGGVASLGTVCLNGEKALGFTAHGQPYGDPFDVDYVAHEIGHQFDGNHTFNSCGGSGPVPYEPGSGTTIMAYAGICGSTNIQLNSDAHFHVANLDEIINFTLNAGGNTCAVITPTGNTPPLIDAGPGGYVIPISTPFELTASASDMEGDSLTFCWEQYDLGPSTIPTQPTGNAPLFRSFPPRNDSTRVFPRISAIVNNTNSTGEILPDYARNMRFRCTVRDNHGFGGGVDWDEITMSVTDVAGPFRVTSQNFGGTWTSGAYEIVTWNVSNTDQAPVNTPMVNIYLSIDGGFTYPITLAEHLPNIGEAAVLVPDSLVANNCRVKVKGAENVFFDINN